MRIPKNINIPLTLSPTGRGVQARGEGGFTYLEIIAGILIITFVLFGMNAVFGVGMRSNKKAERIQRALGLAQDLMEDAIARKFNDWGRIDRTLDELSGTAKPDPILFLLPGNDKKTITVTVTGPDMADVKLYYEVANLKLQ